MISHQVGICRLLEENGFAAAFPLHDGQFDLPQVWSTSKQGLCQKENPTQGRINSSSVEPTPSSSRVLGPMGLLVQVPAARPHPGVLRGEDRYLLCLARLLHRLALARSSRWLGRLSLWSCLYYRAESLSQHKCKHFTAVEALTEIIQGWPLWTRM